MVETRRWLAVEAAVARAEARATELVARAWATVVAGEEIVAAAVAERAVGAMEELAAVPEAAGAA